MDISRSILDNLMGRDRNLPTNSTSSRDHYSNSDVFLISTRSANHSLYVFASTLFSLTPYTMRDHAINATIRILKPCSITISIVENSKKATLKSASVHCFWFRLDWKKITGSLAKDQEKPEYYWEQNQPFQWKTSSDSRQNTGLWQRYLRNDEASCNFWLEWSDWRLSSLLGVGVETSRET